MSSASVAAGAAVSICRWVQQWNATADVGTDEAGLTTLTDEAGLTTLTDEAGGAAASTVPHVVVIAAASGPDSS